MGVRVLIVEDEAMTAMFMEAVMVQAGFEVVKCVSTGEKAVTSAAELKPDILLMDIRLAGKMNGIEATMEIRKFSETPVVFMSGYSDDDIIAQAETLMPLAYFKKPVNSSELIDLISNHFNEA